MAWIRSNKKSSSTPTLATHSGKIYMDDGSIVADSNYIYSDFFDCPDGYAYFDVGENDSGNHYIGVEMCKEDGTHVDWWGASGRFRNVNCATYYRNQNVRKLRLSFRKQYKASVMFIDVVNYKTYSVSATLIDVE